MTIAPGSSQISTKDEVYLSHVSDATKQLYLAPQEHVEIALKLNILLFDRIIINAKSLIGNEYIHGLFVKEQHAMNTMFSSGILSPLITYSSHEDAIDLVQLAERMISTGTIFGVSDDRLIEVAQRISSSHAHLTWASEQYYRDLFSQYLMSILEKSTEKNLPLIARRTAAKVAKFHERDPQHSISSLWRFADCFGESEALKVKKVAEFAAQYAYSNACNTRVSLPQGISGLVNYVRHGIITDRYIGTVRKEECCTSLNFRAITRLPVEEILEIRDLPAFRLVRNELAQVRIGRSQASLELERKLDICMNELYGFASKAINQRAKLYREIRNSARDTQRTRIVTHFIGSSPVLTSIGEMLSKGTYELTAMLTLPALAATIYLSNYRSGAVATPAAQTLAAAQADYEAIDGIIESR